MKLYLASLHLQFPVQFAGLFGDTSVGDVRVKLVVNAFDNYSDERRARHVAGLADSLGKTNFTFEPLDLREYVNKPTALKAELQSADGIWVSGGNVFYLRYLFKQCGLDTFLAQMLEEGLVYGGDSAGAVVIGPNLHGFELLDDPSEAPEVIYEGVAVTRFTIMPHWGNERYAAELIDAKKEIERYTSEIMTISDAQALVVKDEERMVLG